MCPPCAQRPNLHQSGAEPLALINKRPDFRQFFSTCLVFLAGLIACAFLVDRAIEHHYRHHHGTGLIGNDVYYPLQLADTLSPRITAVYLGDSVARQLFHPGREHSGGVRFLTSNQAISMAGQYYLLREAFAHYPMLHDVYLFYFPKSLSNDLGPPFTNDYFCGYFHKPDEVAEIFRFKRDFHLTSVQTGRMLLPSVMAVNSAMQPSISVAVPQGEQGAGPSATSPGGAGAEPVLDLLNRASCARAPIPIPPDPAGEQEVIVSPTSQYFLPRMRKLCRAYHAALHVLPCPCSDLRHFRGIERVYDASVIYVDQGRFVDTVHLQDPFIERVRRKVIDTYRLSWAPPRPAATGE